MQFSSLGLHASLNRTLHDEGYTTPTPIQQQAIPPALEGRDVLGVAQTGTGKTAAFALPILHRLMSATPDKSRRGPILPRALILSPTRELATQIDESFRTYGRHSGLSGTVIFGGVSQFHQVKALQRGIDVLVATPGRLMDLMAQKHVNLSHVECFVLDEADRMLDMGFIDPIRRIAAALPAKRQTMLFSATMPREIAHLAESLLKGPVKVAVTPVSSPAERIEQSVYMVPQRTKQALLEHVLVDSSIKRAVVFTRTKHGADRVMKKLVRAGITADAIHGNKAQNQRQRALDAFKTGRSRVLVATDVAARGLDVDGITHVFNYDLPMEPEAYVHRIGRTARAGASGTAISFCDHAEREQLRAIEKLTGHRLPAITQLPELPEPDRSISHPEDAPRHAHPRVSRREGSPRTSRSGEARPHHDAPRGRHPNAESRPSSARPSNQAGGERRQTQRAPAGSAVAEAPGAGGMRRPTGRVSQMSRRTTRR